MSQALGHGCPPTLSLHGADNMRELLVTGGLHLFLPSDNPTPASPSLIDSSWPPKPVCNKTEAGSSPRAPSQLPVSARKREGGCGKSGASASSSSTSSRTALGTLPDPPASDSQLILSATNHTLSYTHAMYRLTVRCVMSLFCLRARFFGLTTCMVILRALCWQASCKVTSWQLFYMAPRSPKRSCYIILFLPSVVPQQACSLFTNNPATTKYCCKMLCIQPL